MHLSSASNVMLALAVAAGLTLCQPFLTAQKRPLFGVRCRGGHRLKASS